MVDKLEADKTYKCIDLEGYYGSCTNNHESMYELGEEGCYTLTSVDEFGDGFCKGSEVITGIERDYFELVEMQEEANPTTHSTEKPHLWNGKEELALGMELTVVNSSIKFYLKEINPVMGGNQEEVQYLLEEIESGKLHLLCEGDLRTLLPCPRETFIQEVTGQYCTEFATVSTVAGMCYDKLKGGY